MEYATYWLPQHWACPLFYGDVTGMEDSEIEQLESFLEGEQLGAPVGFDETEGEDPQFCRFHDAQPYGVLACDCLPYLFPAPTVS